MNGCEYSHLEEPGDPRDCVSWTFAVFFANAMSRADGLTPAYILPDWEDGDQSSMDWSAGVRLRPQANGYRLPTEAQWEYAARAGTQGQRWPGTDDSERIESYTPPSAPRVVPIRGNSPLSNEWCLHDMSGGIAEWTADWYAPYAGGHDTDPVGQRPTAVFEGWKYPGLKVTRGGLIDDAPAPVWHRSWSHPLWAEWGQGVRLIRLNP